MRIDYPNIAIKFNKEEKCIINGVKGLMKEIYESCVKYDCDTIYNKEGNCYDFNNISKTYDFIDFISDKNSDFILK